MNARLLSTLPELRACDAGEAATVLVVEDDPASRALLAGLLQDEGYRVMLAAGAWEAIDQVEQRAPDLVISDVCMADGDGLGLLHVLRAGPLEGTPIIMVSAQADTERRVRALDLGADDFVAKPLDLEELLARVRSHLRRSQRERELASSGFLDALTGLPNRRALSEFFRREQRLVQRGADPLSLAMVDLNAFKALNDAHGHVAGDAALRAVGRFLLDSARSTDCVGRLGGDEFLIVLCEADQENACEFASRLRARLPLVVELKADVTLPLELAVGVTTARPNEPLDAALPRADAQMYVDKRRSSHPPR